MNAKIIQIAESGNGNHYLIEKAGANCTIDDKEIPVGIVAEVIDMMEIDPSPENEEYPYHVEYSIMALKFHKALLKDAQNSGCNAGEKLDRDSQVFEVHNYCGGVSVSMEGIEGGGENLEGIKSVIKQNNRGGKYRQFKTSEDAEKFIKNVAAKRAPAIFGLIGFFLDRQINLIGNTGWDMIKLQAFNKQYL